MIRISKILVGVTALALAGCAARQERLARNQDNYCTSIGLQFGTPDYAACRMSLHSQQNANDQRAWEGVARALNPPPPGTPGVVVYSR